MPRLAQTRLCVQRVQIQRAQQNSAGAKLLFPKSQQGCVVKPEGRTVYIVENAVKWFILTAQVQCGLPPVVGTRQRQFAVQPVPPPLQYRVNVMFHQQTGLFFYVGHDLDFAEIGG